MARVAEIERRRIREGDLRTLGEVVARDLASGAMVEAECQAGGRPRAAVITDASVFDGDGYGYARAEVG